MSGSDLSRPPARPSDNQVRIDGRQVRLDDRYLLESGTVYLTGIQALVRVLLDRHRLDQRAGLTTGTFVSGYEGSPLAGYDLELARQAKLLGAHDVVHRPGLNEEIAATSVQGSQLVPDVDGATCDGVVGVWYGKAPGLDRATDAIRHANLMGANSGGGVLALVGDDPTSKSSTVPSASEMALADLMLPTLYPADCQDILDLGLHGVALSRACGLWVGMKIITNVADGAGTVDVDLDRLTFPAPERLVSDGHDGRSVANGNGNGTGTGARGAGAYRHAVTAKMVGAVPVQAERSAQRIRLEIARRYARAAGLNTIVHRGPADRIGVVAAGKTYLDTCQALSLLGLDEEALTAHGVRLLKLGMVYPLEGEVVREFADGLAEVVVVEEKRSFVETAVKETLYGGAGAPAVFGKHDPDGAELLPADAELDPDIVAERLASRLLAHVDVPAARAYLDRRRRQRTRTVLPLVPRTPYFCSGCPHNRSTTQVPDGSLVGAGIGCHAMVLLMDPAQVGDVVGLTQMGGEGAQWLGMAPFLDRPHLVQNIGDGTFAHSGSLAVRAAVAAGANLTYKILYNSAVAMTGGQQAVGAMPVDALTRLLAAEGVRHIIVTTDEPARYRGVRLAAGTRVWHRDRLAEAQRVLADAGGVTVLIHDQQCAAEMRRDRKRGRLDDPPTRVVINERVCEGCGDCGRASNCLSVQPVDTEFGRKTRIHQPSCNKDYSCLEGDCPAFVTVVPGPDRGRQRPGSGRPALPEIDAGTLQEPTRRVPAEACAIRITGVGGTGVVTLAQILATAGYLAGFAVRALDQTGLSQKGGAVVSDIVLSERPVARGSKLAVGECDLYLGCDLLVAAEEKNLAAAERDRTVAVVSSTQVPTGQMIVDTAASFPDPTGVLARIGERTRAGLGAHLDARGLAETLFGDDQSANILLTGAAYQAGALPIPVERIEDAIRLNGAAVDRNLQAFRRGRQAVADPAALRAAADALTAAPVQGAAAGPTTGAAAGPTQGEDAAPAARMTPVAASIVARVRAVPESELAQLVAIRVPDLVAYQDAGYATRYADVVERVRATEAERVPGETALAETVARYLYKLMAYKDEYEVARLCLDSALESDIAARFGPGARYAWRLHPPILRSLGMRRKIALGGWCRPAFVTLHAMRKLRGTALDPFGYTRVRATERELVTEYHQVVADLLTRLNPDNHATALQVAALPDIVRGYERLKLDNVDTYRRRLGELRAAFAEAGQAPELSSGASFH